MEQKVLVSTVFERLLKGICKRRGIRAILGFSGIFSFSYRSKTSCRLNLALRAAALQQRHNRLALHSMGRGDHRCGVAQGAATIDNRLV
jgi:hypothetical protein